MSTKPGALAPVAPSDGPEQAESGGGSSSFLSEIRSGGVGADGAPLPESTSPPRFRVSGPTALVLVVAAVGIGALLGMRKLTSPGAAMATVNIDYTPGQRGVADAHKRLVEVLDRSTTPVQVPTDQIKKNPFQFATAPTTATPIAKGGEDAEAAAIRMRAAELAARQKKIVDALGTLKVNGVMQGSVPVARVNGEMVRIGDTIAEGLFTVAAIGGRGVTLQADGREYELAMEEVTSGSKAPRRR